MTLGIDLKGKRALVAGVADDGGLGWGIAHSLAEAGASVVLGVWPPAMGIFETLLARGKLDESRKLSDGSMLVTERIGRLRIVRDGKLDEQPIAGVPIVRPGGPRGLQGLMDIALHPQFEQNHWVYLTYHKPTATGAGATTLARGEWNGTALVGVKDLFESGATGTEASRLVFGRDGNLFVTLGDRFDLRDQAQNPATHLGKVIRIKPGGGAAEGNPFLNRQGAKPEIWSLGHRNIQSAALHPTTGALWTVEHGARGGDEVNIPAAGKNYGWPVISYGVDYSGAKIGEGTKKQGLEQPVYFWDPSIAPSGMAFYEGSLFQDWKDNILIGGLSSQALIRLTVEGNRVVQKETLLDDRRRRIRDVRQGPDGYVYVLTDASPGELLRLAPAETGG